jgi:hypothetical protein
MAARFELTTSLTQLWKPDSNPRPVQHSYEAFHQSNQKHSQKKVMNIKFELTFYILKFSKLKTQESIQSFKIILILWHINAEPEKVLQ